MHNDILYEDACRFLEAYKPEDAKELLDQILQNDPNSVRAINKMGIVHIQMQNLYEAENAFNKALELDPTYAPALVNLGNLCQEVGDIEKAMSYYEEAKKKDDEYPMSYYNMAIIFRKQGDIKKYMDYIKTYKRMMRRYNHDMTNSIRITAKRRIGCLPAIIMIAVSVAIMVTLIQ